MKKLRSILAVGALLVCQVMSTNAQQTVFSENFNSGASAWTIVNGTQTNKWYCGTATFAGATGSSMYISDNNSAHQYTTSSASVVHFYRDVTFPAGSNLAGYHLSFDLIGMGTAVADYLAVFLVETAVTPVMGINLHDSIPQTCIGSFNRKSSWRQADIVLPISLAGTTKRLVFSWRNAGVSLSNLQPPAAVDNIVLKTLPMISKTLTATAGTVGNTLTTLDKTTTTHLTVTGSIDARDIKCMRDNMPVLTHLDLSGANIVAYSGTAGTAVGNVSYLANRIPHFAFHDSLLTTGAGNRNGKNSLHSIVLPAGVTIIEMYAFSHCRNLTTISFPNGLTTINHYAFYFCSKLSSISLPNSTNHIARYAFGYNTSLSSVSLSSNGLTYLGVGAFTYCRSLTSIDIPNTLDTISQEAFADCSNLASLTIGKSVKHINTNAFRQIVNLPEITIKALIPPTGASNAFNAVPTSIPVNIPCGKLIDYQNVAVWVPFTNLIESVAHEVTLLSADTTMGTAVLTTPNTCSNFQATITATPKSGHRFLEWNDGDATNPRTISVMADVTHTATFIKTYNITVQANNATYGTVTGGGTYDKDSTTIIDATPNSGYTFVQWSDGETTTPRTITVVADATYTAEFASTTAPTYTITLTSNNASMGSVVGAGTYIENTTATLKAIPTAAHRFVQWSDGNTDTLRVVTVTANLSLIATFEVIPTYVITVGSSNTAWGNVIGGGTFNENDTATIIAVPSVNYRFVKWQENNSTDNPYKLTVTANATYTAEFALATAQSFNVTVVANDPTMGTVTGTGVYVENATATITATPNAGYQFVQWNDGNTTTSRTITVTEDATYTATFEAIPATTYTITVSVNDATMGTATGGGTFAANTTTTITATPNAGYKFVKWQEDNNTVASRTITVTANATYTAEFEAENSIYDAQVSAVSIYPNPAAENITISLPDNTTHATFVIYDLQGRTLLQQNIIGNKETISIVGLSTGVYTYSVSTDAQHYNGRLNIVK